MQDMEGLKARAEAGDADAQYQMAAFCSGQGRGEEAGGWLEKAAQNGSGDATYTLATRALQSSDGLAEAHDLLARSVKAGTSSAMRLLGAMQAEGLGVAPDWSKGVGLIIKAAKQGDRSAMREIAMLALIADSDNNVSDELLARAAPADAVAAIILVRRAGLGFAVGYGAEVEQALENLKVAQYPRLDALRAGLDAGRNHVTQTPPGEIDWPAVEKMIGVEPNIAEIETELICESPRVTVKRNLFSLEETEYVIAIAARRLGPSMTVDPRDGSMRKDVYRTSLTATLGPVDNDLVMVALMRRMATAAGTPFEQGEFLSVLHYGIGQEYRPHFDWLPQGPDFDRGGQRVKTALIYLNSDCQGGETHFLSPDIKFRGEAGDFISFDNVGADGEPDMQSRHASIPVISGEKWLASKWYRAAPYRF